MGHYVKELSYAELQPHLEAGKVIVLPVGGGSKEHGGHLPMGTDLIVTEWLADRLTERCDVLTLPPLAYGYFPAFIEWRGSVSVGHEHFTGMVADIIRSFTRHGSKKYLVIDGGVSTHGPLCVMARELHNETGALIGISDCEGLGAEVHDEVCSQKAGGHGDESETSCVLAIRPDLVHMDKTVEEYKGGHSYVSNGHLKVFVPTPMDTPSGTNGDSTLATKEKGDKILSAMVDDLCEFVARLSKAEV